MRVLIACLCVFLPLLAQASVHEDVFRATQECTASATTLEEQRNCQVRATPRICRDYLRGPLNERRSMAMRQVWLKCLGSCDDANWYSRLFGECSTPSDPNK